MSKMKGPVLEDNERFALMKVSMSIKFSLSMALMCPNKDSSNDNDWQK